jgi:hypothetical protein
MYYAGESNVPGAPGNLMAGNPFGRQFEIPGRSSSNFGNLTPSDIQRLMEENPSAADRIQQRYQKMQGGVQLPMVQGLPTGGTPMGNAGFYMGPQLGQMVPPAGFQNKTVS